MIDQLRPGMTRRQVRFIMGNPLIVDTFHANRWDYLYSIQPGGGRRQQERVSLFFNDSDQLAGLNGDFMPGVSRDEAILGKEGSTTVTQPADQQKPEEQKEEPPKPGSTLEQLQREVDEAQPVPVPTPNLWTPARNDGWRSCPAFAGLFISAGNPAANRLRARSGPVRHAACAPPGIGDQRAVDLHPFAGLQHPLLRASQELAEDTQRTTLHIQPWKRLGDAGEQHGLACAGTCRHAQAQ